MEFPIEIQMLINDYARPISRPDWRKGSFMVRYYRSEKGKWGQLPIWNFKEYINQRRYDRRTNYRYNYKAEAHYYEDLIETTYYPYYSEYHLSL